MSHCYLSLVSFLIVIIIIMLLKCLTAIYLYFLLGELFLSYAHFKIVLYKKPIFFYIYMLYYMFLYLYVYIGCAGS